jgi:hypothetical protein
MTRNLRTIGKMVLSSLLLSTALAACTVGPDYTPPQTWSNVRLAHLARHPLTGNLFFQNFGTVLATNLRDGRPEQVLAQGTMNDSSAPIHDVLDEVPTSRYRTFISCNW